MHALLEEDRLILTVSAQECAVLWSHDEAVYLHVWHPTTLEVYISRWCHMPGDLWLAGHLDFRDAAGRTWLEVYDVNPPLTWESSVTHPRFAWLHANNPHS